MRPMKMQRKRVNLTMEAASEASATILMILIYERPGKTHI
jgi:hypothetical protein